MKKKELFDEFWYLLNRYEISSDAIDDDNEMLKHLIKECREFLKSLNYTDPYSLSESKKK